MCLVCFHYMFSFFFTQVKLEAFTGLICLYFKCVLSYIMSFLIYIFFSRNNVTVSISCCWVLVYWRVLLPSPFHGFPSHNTGWTGLSSHLLHTVAWSCTLYVCTVVKHCSCTLCKKYIKWVARGTLFSLFWQPSWEQFNVYAGQSHSYECSPRRSWTHCET